MVFNHAKVPSTVQKVRHTEIGYFWPPAPCHKSLTRAPWIMREIFVNYANWFFKLGRVKFEIVRFDKNYKNDKISNERHKSYVN
jgi:hypothetical protein